MNDRERDRCSDGAGPVAPDEGGPSRRSLRHFLTRTGILLTLTTSAFVVSAQYAREIGQSGLSVTIGAGLLKAGNHHAHFYDGSDGNANSINRILHSEAYGPTIWANLTEQDLIASSVGSYQQLTIVDEVRDMYYRLSVQLGIGLRYDYDNGWGWQLHFDYAKLNAIGAFHLDATNGAGPLTNIDRYVPCAIAGQEQRYFIDLGLNRQFRLNSGLDLSFQLGGSLNNTSVMSNDILIAGRTYSILDVWNGQSPNAYSQEYPYLNQGGIGYGGYVGVSLGYVLPNYDALSLGYTFHYSKINLEGYESFAPQHLLALRMDVANFSFFDID